MQSTAQPSVQPPPRREEQQRQQLRARLLEMIVKNESQRKSPPG